MKPVLDHSKEIIFNNALRIAVGDLAEIHPRIENQLLADCMLDDLSDLNFDDLAVKAFMNMIRHEIVSMMTVGKLRNEVIKLFSENTEYLIAQEWKENNNLEELAELCARGANLKHLNQLLFYIGGKSLNESYEIAKKTPPTYGKDSEHSGVRYSLGLNHCIDDLSYHEESSSYLEYSTTNILQLMAEARYIMEEELSNLIECSHATQCDLTIRELIIYMNNIEILSFEYDMDVEDFHKAHLDLATRMAEAKNIVGSDSFKSMLLNGMLFSSDEYHPLRQRMKGKALEEALGM